MVAAEVLPQDLVFVDLETTGGNAARHRITEIGIVRVANGELVEEWSSLVNPECPIPAHIRDFTGISDEMVRDAPRFADIAEQVRQKLSGAVFVAHNARFDYSFLRSEFQRQDASFAAKVLCTVKLSRRLFPQFPRHNLDAVMERHGLACGSRHRALGDARVLHDFWRVLRRDVPAATLSAAATALLTGPKLPAHLPADLADDLPEGPGVYRFFGENNVLLYVGKSHSLRGAVLKHLAAEDPARGAARLADQVHRVDWSQTAGELGAALRERECIRTLQPAHNRRIKSKGGAFTLRMVTGPGPGARTGAGTGADGAGGGAMHISLTAIDALERQDLAHCFGVFQSQKDARKAFMDIAAAKQLCLKVLGFEDGVGSCLAYQILKCKGACIGKEPQVLHNMRLQLALSALKLKSWPFPGRIALRELAPRAGFTDQPFAADMHVLDDWAYLGTAHSDAELAALAAQECRSAFDVDVYKILVRYFADNPKLDWHDLRDKTSCA